MEKTKYKFLIFLLLITGYANAQYFKLENERPNLSGEYNTKLSKALHKNNALKLKKILNKQPQSINDITDYASKSKYSRLSGGGKILLFDAVERYLDDNCPYEIIETIMHYKPFLYCTYKGKTPLYLLLDFFATHKIKECNKAEKLLNLFCKQEGFNAGRRQINLPPPLSYLIIKNNKFLNHQISNDYLSTNVLKTLILNGASPNSLDDNENNLLDFALKRDRKELVSFLLNKGTLVNNKNTTGKDAFVTAIEIGNLPLLEKIYKNGYKLSLDVLYKQNVQYSLKKHPKVKDFIYQIANSKESLDIDESIAFLGLFDQKGDIFTKKHFNGKTSISKEDFPKLIHFISNNTIEITQENYLKLKIDYLKKSVDIEELWSNAEKINFNLETELVKDYWKSEQTTNQMKENMLQNKFFDAYHKSKFNFKIEAKKDKYYKKILKGYRYDENYKRLHTFALLGSSYFKGKYFFSPNVTSFIAAFPSKKEEIKKKLSAYIHSVELYYPSHSNSSLFGKEYYAGAEEIVKRYKFAQFHTAGFKEFIADYNKAFGFNNTANRFSEVENYCRNIENKIIYYSKRIDIEAQESNRIYAQKMCDECKIDHSKTKSPRETGLILKTHRSGIIKMVNGNQYKWEYSSDGKYSIPGFFSSKEFDSFDKMLEYFLKKCKEQYCR